ncbi:MAG: dethiobiotin synthase [Nocardioides sp.]
MSSGMDTGRVVVVTGTSTGVGKTIATAALAVRFRSAGSPESSVVVVKPVQTGVRPGDPTDPGDASEVHRLTGTVCQEFTALTDPLAPDTAARLRNVELPPVAEYADRIRVLAGFHDVVIVEGAGGILVRLDRAGGTLLDLAAECGAELIVVTSVALGTLNHTELTVAAIRARGIEPAGLIIGSWPAEPGLAEHCNADDLPRLTGVPVLATIPAGAGALDPERFRSGVAGWFG